MTSCSSVLGIFNSEEWKKLYPREEYIQKPTTPRVIGLALHYLLGLGQSDAVVMKYIETTGKTNPGRLCSIDTGKYKWTPLMIAAMRGRTLVVRALLDFWKGKGSLQTNLRSLDTYDWTALHHAAISSKEIFTLLCEYGADQKARTLLGGTPEDLRVLTSRNIVNFSDRSVFYKGADGALILIAELGSQRLQEYTGLECYRDDTFVPEGALKALWQQEAAAKIEQNQMWLRMTPMRASRQCPSMVLTECAPLVGKTPRPLGLVAKEKIPFGAYLGEYTGEMQASIQETSYFVDDFAQNSKSVEYLFGTVDAQTIGNHTRWMNWGWPNCVLLGVGIDGFNKSVCYVCDPKGVEKDEPILWDYGIGETRLAFGEPFVLLGREKMRDFFRKGLKASFEGAKQIEKKITLGVSEKKELELHLEAICYGSRIIFPLNVPSALLDLHFSGIVPAKDWLPHLFFQLPDTPRGVEIWRQRYPSAMNRITAMMWRLTQLDLLAQVVGQGFREKLAEWALRSLGEMSVMQIVKGLDMIAQNPHEYNAGNKLWQDLNPFLAHYDWLKDEEAPLGIKRSRSARLELLLILCGGSKEGVKKSINESISAYEKSGDASPTESMEDLVWMLEQL